MDFENKPRLKSTAELAMEKVKDKEISENTQDETIIEDEERKKEAEKSASGLKEMNLKDKIESSQKADEIRKKIENDELQSKAWEMMSPEEEELSIKRQILLEELGRWAEEDPVKLAKSVELSMDDNPEGYFKGQYEYLNKKGEKIMKMIGDKDIRNAIVYIMETKDGRRIKTGSAELKINKGLEGLREGKKWVENIFMSIDGKKFNTIEHSWESVENKAAIKYYKIAEKLHRLLTHDKDSKIYWRKAGRLT